jgi:hypothetical protein
MFTEKVTATIVVLIGGAAAICARRYNNTDNEAGSGIAFGMFLVLLAIW